MARKKKWWEQKKPKRGEAGYESRLGVILASLTEKEADRLEMGKYEGIMTDTQFKIYTRETEMGLPLFLYVNGATLTQILEAFEERGWTQTWLYRALQDRTEMRGKQKGHVPPTKKEFKALIEEYLDREEEEIMNE